eukprot:164867_1
MNCFGFMSSNSPSLDECRNDAKATSELEVISGKSTVHKTTKQDALRHQNIYKCNKSDCERKLKDTSHSALVIFDWDNTLFPTFELQNPDLNKFRVTSEKLGALSQAIYEVISVYIAAYKARNIRIVSASAKGWIRSSLLRVYNIGCFKEIYNLIFVKHQIQLIHPKSIYLPFTAPRQVSVWKYRVFQVLLRDRYEKKRIYEMNTHHTLISIGDSIYEFEASKQAAMAFNNVFVHRLKLIEQPSLKEMMDQMRALLEPVNGFFHVSSKRSKMKNGNANITIDYGRN